MYYKHFIPFYTVSFFNTDVIYYSLTEISSFELKNDFIANMCKLFFKTPM